MMNRLYDIWTKAIFDPLAIIPNSQVGLSDAIKMQYEAAFLNRTWSDSEDLIEEPESKNGNYQSCPYCNSKNEIINSNCVKCGGPLG